MPPASRGWGLFHETLTISVIYEVFILLQTVTKRDLALRHTGSMFPFSRRGGFDPEAAEAKRNSER
jgi:hypothetical protein